MLPLGGRRPVWRTEMGQMASEERGRGRVGRGCFNMPRVHLKPSLSPRCCGEETQSADMLIRREIKGNCCRNKLTTLLRSLLHRLRPVTNHLNSPETENNGEQSIEGGASNRKIGSIFGLFWFRMRCLRSADLLPGGITLWALILRQSHRFSETPCRGDPSASLHPPSSLINPDLLS